MTRRACKMPPGAALPPSRRPLSIPFPAVVRTTDKADSFQTLIRRVTTTLSRDARVVHYLANIVARRETVARSNLTRGRIAAAHESLTRIRQVAPVRTLI